MARVNNNGSAWARARRARGSATARHTLGHGPRLSTTTGRAARRGHGHGGDGQRLGWLSNGLGELGHGLSNGQGCWELGGGGWSSGGGRNGGARWLDKAEPGRAQNRGEAGEERNRGKGRSRSGLRRHGGVTGGRATEDRPASDWAALDCGGRNGELLLA
ncbi:uncharacterized protein LOC130135910 [Syzygium oleosum]|uniref:uncharacterized protein LOC130135910 n=1 Tax=Syzygium oleosum TaxID=219896 RepID=UPI0024B950B9|nr:uncharacterized protein LOC130135910 [Syzygium oleosum]